MMIRQLVAWMQRDEQCVLGVTLATRPSTTGDPSVQVPSGEGMFGADDYCITRIFFLLSVGRLLQEDTFLGVELTKPALFAAENC